MKLGEIMARYSRIRVATRQDNQRILDFLNSVSSPTVAGPVSFHFRREPDYFRYLDYQNEKSFVFLFLNDDGSIGGVASFGTRHCYLEEHSVNSLYFADIRTSVKMSRTARVEWRQWYADMVAHAGDIEEFGNPEFLYTLVMDGNEAPLRAVRKRKTDIVYEPLAQYQTINILGRRPRWSRKRGPRGWHVRRATVTDLPRLRCFLYESNRIQPLGHHFTLNPWNQDGAPLDELQRRLSVWDGLEIESFQLLEDEEGKVIACVAPWSFDRARQLCLKRMSKPLKFLGQLVRLFGRPPIVEGKSLKILNLTHLEICASLNSELRHEALRLLVDHCWEMPEMRGAHMLAAADFHDEFSHPDFQRYVIQKTPATLYRVYSESQTAGLPHFQQLKQNSTAFEIGIP